MSVEVVKKETKAIAKSPINDFRDMLEKMKPQIAMALPKHLDVARLMRIAITTVQRTPDLLDCTRESLFGCLMQCAQLGLEPDGLLGHAYLIPFNDRKTGTKICTLIIGYKGLLKLARQSGEVSSISARVVHSKDHFSYSYGLVEKLEHLPSDEEDPGELTHAYAIFRLKDGAVHFDVMSKREIEAIKKRSKTSGFGPWVTDYEEMAKKTILRRASKMSPASIEDRTARAIALDEQADADIPQVLDDHGLSLPPESVPGSEPENQGRRMSLGKVPPKSEVVPNPLIARRAQLAKAIGEAMMIPGEIAEAFNRASIDELTAEEVEKAFLEVSKVTGEVPAP